MLIVRARGAADSGRAGSGQVPSTRTNAKVEAGQVAEAPVLRHQLPVQEPPERSPSPGGPDSAMLVTGGLEYPARADHGLDFHFESLAELGIPAVATDLDGLICFWNRPAGELYGGGQHEMLGTGIGTIRLLDADDATAATIVSELLRVGRWHGTIEVERAHNSPLRLEARAMVLIDDNDQPAGFEAVFRDLTETVMSGRRTAENQSQLRLANRNSAPGSWQWDPRTDRLFPSDLSVSLLGLDPSTVMTISDALAAMPSADRARVRSALEGMRSPGVDSLDVAYTLQDTDGAPRSLQAHCAASRDYGGKLTLVRGTTQDVTARVRADDRLREAETFWQATLDSLAAHIAILDEHGTIIAVNAAWRRFAESEGGDSDYIGSNYISVCQAATDPLATVVARGLGEILAGAREDLQLDYPCHSPSQQRWFLFRATRFAGSGPMRVVVLHADMTERHQVQEQAFLQAELLDQIDVSVILTDLDLTVLSWNAGAERLYGWSAQEAIGRPASETILPPESVLPAEEGKFNLASQSDGRWDGEYIVRRKDGSTFPAHVRSRLISDQDGHVTGAATVAMDITARKESERALVSARNYLRAVTDGVGEGLFTIDSAGCASYMNQVALDLLGWSWEELQGRELHPILHPLRLDGSPMPVEECPMFHARRDGKLVRVENDMFICRDGRHLPVAYTASPFATDDGIEGCVVLFEDNTERQATASRVERDLEKLAWLERVQEALTEERFVLYSQPIIELRTGEIAQRELLIRMRDAQAPDGTYRLIAPGTFLPVAEEFGLITEIDRWVIDRASEIAAAGDAVQLNVSARSINAPGLVDHIKHAIQRTGADPTRIVFEITETALIDDGPVARGFVEAVHALGCKIALDDFGTGYGGFTYLKQLPVDFLKIDIEFVRDVQSNSASRNVIQAIVGLAAGFGLKTVGEGVEDEGSLKLLRELGVDYAQGFHVGRPAPVETVTQPANEGDLK
jgi:PAS domain S-box-containing protein